MSGPLLDLGLAPFHIGRKINGKASPCQKFLDSIDVRVSLLQVSLFLLPGLCFFLFGEEWSSNALRVLRSSPSEMSCTLVHKRDRWVCFEFASNFFASKKSTNRADQGKFLVQQFYQTFCVRNWNMFDASPRLSLTRASRETRKPFLRRSIRLSTRAESRVDNILVMFNLWVDYCSSVEKLLAKTFLAAHCKIVRYFHAVSFENLLRTEGRTRFFRSLRAAILF